MTVVGSGPNGLSAALVCAQAGLSVRVIEAQSTLGGNARTAELIEDGFFHDVGAAVHPMAFASPFFRDIGLAERVSFTTPETSYAHGITADRVGVAYRDLARTALELGDDGRAWNSLFAPLVNKVDRLSQFTLSNPLSPRVPGATAIRFAADAARSGLGPEILSRFRGEIARAMIAGVDAHAIGSGRSMSGSLIGLALATHAHAQGWPIPHGGSQSIIDELHRMLSQHDVEFVTNNRITNIEEVSDSEILLLDVTPRDFASMSSGVLSEWWRHRMRSFRYGPGIAKIDATLDGPIPWSNPALADAGTVHLGGNHAQLYTSERQIARGQDPREVFVLLAQPSRFDSSRAPAGKHVLWAYAHVPAGSTRDMTEPILAKIEEFAPGFRDQIRAVRHQSAVDMARANPNNVGGDIGAGATTLWQIVGRPRLSAAPWRTPLEGVYLCSASTSPGPGVHGMSGWHAARVALRDIYGIDLRRSSTYSGLRSGMQAREPVV